MSPRGRRWDAIKFININLFLGASGMKTILAIDLGKRNSVFCRLSTSSLKSEYFTAKTDPQRFHDIFIDLDIKSSFNDRDRIQSSLADPLGVIACN